MQQGTCCAVRFKTLKGAEHLICRTVWQMGRVDANSQVKTENKELTIDKLFTWPVSVLLIKLNVLYIYTSIHIQNFSAYKIDPLNLNHEYILPNKHISVAVMFDILRGNSCAKSALTVSVSAGDILCCHQRFLNMHCILI